MSETTFPKGRIGFRKLNPDANNTKHTIKSFHLMFPDTMKPINILGAYSYSTIQAQTRTTAILYLVEKQVPTHLIQPDLTGLVGRFHSYTHLTAEEVEKFGDKEKECLAWIPGSHMNFIEGNRFGKITLERIDD